MEISQVIGTMRVYSGLLVSCEMAEVCGSCRTESLELALHADWFTAKESCLWRADSSRAIRVSPWEPSGIDFPLYFLREGTAEPWSKQPWIFSCLCNCWLKSTWFFYTHFDNTEKSQRQVTARVYTKATIPELGAHWLSLKFFLVLGIYSMVEHRPSRC
jgi:hypothetical protein